MEKGYVRAAAGQVHFRMCGNGRPLLLLHQSPSSGAMWEPALPLFAEQGFRAIAPDMPGYGASYCPSEPPSLEYYAQVMLEAATLLGVGSFDIVGHHTGAAVALQLGQLAPQRISRIVVWGVPLLEPNLRARLATEPVPSFDDEGDAIKAYWARRRGLSGAAYSESLGVRCAIEMLQTGRSRPWGHWAVAQADIELILRSVPQPTLVLCGERDPVWERSREATALLRNGTFACIEGAGLDVVDQFADRFVVAASTFLGSAGRA